MALPLAAGPSLHGGFMHRRAMVTSSPMSPGFLHPGAQCQSHWPSLADWSTQEGEQYDWPTRPRSLWQ